MQFVLDHMILKLRLKDIVDINHVWEKEIQKSPCCPNTAARAR